MKFFGENLGCLYFTTNVITGKRIVSTENNTKLNVNYDRQLVSSFFCCFLCVLFFCFDTIHLDFLVDLLGLLKWNSMVGKLKDILVTVMKVSGEEIVKVCP